MRIFGFSDWLVQRQHRFWLDAIQDIFQLARNDAIFGVLARIPQMIVGLFIMVWSFRLTVSGQVDVSEFLVILLSVTTMVETLFFIQSMPGKLRSDMGFLPDLYSILDLQSTNTQPSNIEAKPLKKAIVFEDVWFSYPGNNKPVLCGLNLIIPVGTSVALLGENGSGKSTIIKLLLGMYIPDKGRILWDDIDIRHINTVSLRKQLSVVFQDFVHFPSTLAENIAVGSIENITNTSIVEQAAKVSRIDRIANKLPQGYLTELLPDQGGVDLSGGQWQRVAISRAIAAQLGHRASVAVVDEPTAALDIRAESALYRQWVSLASSATVLLISHRLTTVRVASHIVILKDGVVAEQGSHEELLEQNRLYALWYNLDKERKL